MGLLLQYLLHPFQTVRTHVAQLRLWHSLAALGVFSMSMASGVGIMRPGLLVLLVVIWGAINIVNAVIIDFFAQCFGSKGNSVALFKGLTLSLALWILFKPVQLLKMYIPDDIFWLMYLGFLSFVFSVQIETLKQIYNIKTAKAWALWIVPGLLIAVTVVASFMGLFYLV